MAVVRRKLNPGEIVIGFVCPNGQLIGQFAEPSIGHEALSDQYPGLGVSFATACNDLRVPTRPELPTENPSLPS